MKVLRRNRFGKTLSHGIVTLVQQMCVVYPFSTITQIADTCARTQWIAIANLQAGLCSTISSSILIHFRKRLPNPTK